MTAVVFDIRDIILRPVIAVAHGILDMVALVALVKAVIQRDFVLQSSLGVSHQAS